MELDQADLTLIQELQRDAAQRLEDLARKVQMAPSSVHERLRRLESSAILKRWTIEIDAARLGLGVLAYVGIRATRPCSEILPVIELIPAVEEAHSVAGELSLMLKIRVTTTAALLELIDRLRQIPGVEGTETTIVLKTQFDRPTSLPPGEAPRRSSRGAAQRSS